MANEITWRLEHERIGRLLLHYAMPAVIGTMVNALYNICLLYTSPSPRDE